MWHESNYYSRTLSWISYNYGGQFQYFSGVDLELNNLSDLITNLIIVAIIVHTHMIPGLTYLIDCATTGLISKIPSYLG